MNLVDSEQALIEIAAKGDASALSRLLALHRGRLERMIQARMDRRLSARMDASELSEVDRTILVLRHVDQLTSEEAAAELGISGSTCRQRHLRALKRLKDLLEPHSLDWNSR